MLSKLLFASGTRSQVLLSEANPVVLDASTLLVRLIEVVLVRVWHMAVPSLPSDDEGPSGHTVSALSCPGVVRQTGVGVSSCSVGRRPVSGMARAAW